MAQPTEQGAKSATASEPRKDYAAERTILANERTYTAWIRTGLTALAAGIAIEKFMAELVPGWGISAIAMIFVLVSAFAFMVAAWRYTHLGLDRSRTELRTIPWIVTTGISVLLVACSLIAFVDIWIAN